MREFDPDQLLLMGLIHGVKKLSGELDLKKDINQPLNQNAKDEYLHDAKAAETLCSEVDLPISKKAIEKIKESLSENNPKLKDLLALNQELEHIMSYEMESRKFFSIEPDKCNFLNKTDLFGTEVSSAFPSTNFDIEEAGKCLAFERWTASVSHLMKVLEVGLVTLAEDIGIPSDQKNWGGIISEIEKKIEKNSKNPDADWKGKEQFYSEAALQFRYFKNAWRNHVMHARKIAYDEERATSIYQRTKEFMKTLATRLKEDST